jgi:hypothetical protein
MAGHLAGETSALDNAPGRAREQARVTRFGAILVPPPAPSSARAEPAEARAKERATLATYALLNAIAELTGLTPLLAPGTVRRALRDAGVDPTYATVDDILRALPSLTARMRAFQSEGEARARAQRIESLLMSWPR